MIKYSAVLLLAISSVACSQPVSCSSDDIKLFATGSLLRISYKSAPDNDLKLYSSYGAAKKIYEITDITSSKTGDVTNCAGTLWLLDNGKKLINLNISYRILSNNSVVTNLPIGNMKLTPAEMRSYLNHVNMVTGYIVESGQKIEDSKFNKIAIDYYTKVVGN